MKQFLFTLSILLTSLSALPRLQSAAETGIASADVALTGSSYSLIENPASLSRLKKEYNIFAGAAFAKRSLFQLAIADSWVSSVSASIAWHAEVKKGESPYHQASVNLGGTIAEHLCIAVDSSYFTGGDTPGMCWAFTPGLLLKFGIFSAGVDFRNLLVTRSNVFEKRFASGAGLNFSNHIASFEYGQIIKSDILASTVHSFSLGYIGRFGKVFSLNAGTRASLCKQIEKRNEAAFALGVGIENPWQRMTLGCEMEFLHRDFRGSILIDFPIKTETRDDSNVL